MTAALLEGDDLKTGQTMGGRAQSRPCGLQRPEGIGGTQGIAELRDCAHEVLVVGARARSGTQAFETIRCAFEQPPRRRKHRMIGNSHFAAGGFQNQKAGKLRGDLLQVLEVRLGGEDIAGGLIVDHYRITNGFGTFPAMSIHTLFVCRYSRMASIPFSRPIPDRL